MKTIAVALGILYQGDRFLLQLRDDIQGIVYPGCWTLFGGHLEAGETPEQGLVREIKEEINYQLSTPIVFGSYNDQKVSRYVFYHPLTVGLDRLVLGEGQDMALVGKQDIIRGSCYSAKIRQWRPLGPPHQQILLEFLTARQEQLR